MTFDIEAIKNDSARPTKPKYKPRNIVPRTTEHNWTLYANIKIRLFSKARIFDVRIDPIVPGITVNDNICKAKIDSINFGKRFSIKIGDKKKPLIEIRIDSKIRYFFNRLFFFWDTFSGKRYL